MAGAPTIFTVHTATKNPADWLRFAPHRFSWAALVFGPLWLAKQRLWLPALLMLVLAGSLVAGLRSGDIDAQIAIAVWFLASVFTGLEGQELRRRALARRGFMLTGLVYASDEADALAQIAFRRQAAVTEGAGS